MHFDVAMTVVADTLYTMLAKQLLGFEDCNVDTLFRGFVRGSGEVEVRDGVVKVTYPRRAHNPILRQVPWHRLPMEIPGLEGARLELQFR